MPFPALRLGYLVNGNDAAVARMRRQQMPWSVNALAALAGEIALQDSAASRRTAWLRRAPGFIQALCQLPTAVGLSSGQTICYAASEDIDLQRRLLTLQRLIRSCANYPGWTAAIIVNGDAQLRKTRRLLFRRCAVVAYRYNLLS